MAKCYECDGLGYVEFREIFSEELQEFYCEDVLSIIKFFNFVNEFKVAIVICPYCDGLGNG